MDGSVGVPRTSEAEGLSVVSSLSEVSEQITITDEIPTEHDSTHSPVFHHNEVEEHSTEEIAEHQQCEVQVVKVANVGGGVNITFSTPALNLARGDDPSEVSHTHTIQVSEAALAPIQEVAIAQSPDHSTRSTTPNLQADQGIGEIQDEQESLEVQDGSPETPSRRDHDGQKSSWVAVLNAEVLTVRCRNETAELHKSKLGSGGRGKCIKYDGEWMTPSEFEARCGRASSKDWKRSIRYSGRTLQTLIEEGVLTPHATSCTCASCCNDDTLAGPVRLFVPYKRRKRVSSQSSLASPVLKKSMSLSADPTKRDGGHSIMLRSVSVDSAGGTFVTEAGNVIDAGDLQASSVTSGSPSHHLPLLKDLTTGLITVSAGQSLHSHTPVTPMTPLTPMAPMTPVLMTPCTPLATQITSLPSQAITVTMAVPVTEGSLDQRRHWWHIEEMVNSLLSTAQQLKCMIEQAKLQSEAAREAAIAQAKLQAEAEKKEALAQSRMNMLLQLSKALNDAQAEKELAVAQALAHAKADKLEAMADARHEQFIKTGIFLNSRPQTSAFAFNPPSETTVTHEQPQVDDKNGME